MSANKLNTTTFNTVAANTVADAVIDAPSILAWRQDVQAVVNQHADQINAIQVDTPNAIINGGFNVNQRVKSGTVTLAAGAYGHDRWKAGASGCTYTFATSANVTTITITAGSLIQVIEGLNLFSGTYTLSWTGTSQGKIGAGSYGASGITGSATGGTDLNIEFNTGTLSKVQFSLGSSVVPFQPRSFSEELALCQRYYEKSYDQGTAPSSSTASGSASSVAVATNVLIGFRFKTVKRVTPTVAIISPSGTAQKVWSNSDVDTSSSVLASFAGDSGARYLNCVGSGLTAGLIYSYHYTADAEL